MRTCRPWGWSTIIWWTAFGIGRSRGSGSESHPAGDLDPLNGDPAALRREQHRHGSRPGYKFQPRGRCKTRPVIDLLRFVFGLAADLVRRRVELVADNALLRQQLIGAKRKLAGRAQRTPWQRFTIVLAARVAPAWREATLLIQPATILLCIAQDSARSGGVALGGRDDRRRRVPRSS